MKSNMEHWKTNILSKACTDRLCRYIPRESGTSSQAHGRCRESGNNSFVSVSDRRVGYPSEAY